jgi:uncharacterized protein (DUF433 family)
MVSGKNEIDWSKVPGVGIDPERQSGAPVFAGTRVAVNVVTNNIHRGGTKAEIDTILDNFNVTREQIDLVEATAQAGIRHLGSARP